tara:strand:+ start:7110 stop:7328 length:219 start_codon:yes stop_codon:yes gene_type:complete
MKDMLLKALRAYYNGEIAKHKANVEIMLEKTAGVAEHPDTIETISSEIMKIAEFEDALLVLDQHFNTQIPKI